MLKFIYFVCFLYFGLLMREHIIKNNFFKKSLNMTRKELANFGRNLSEINEKGKMIINTIKQIDENVLAFGIQSVYKNDSFTIDEKNEVVRYEYFDWGFNYCDYDYIELPFKEFNTNIDKWCKNYVKNILTKEKNEKLTYNNFYF